MREGLAWRIKRILSPEDNLPSGGKRAQVIAISNQKGGVGKTTTAVNLGAGLVLFHQKKVLLIDLDAQGHVSVSLQRPFAENGSGLSTLLTAKNASLLDAISPTDLENLDITLSDRSLIETEGQLAAKIGREFILREVFGDKLFQTQITVNTDLNKAQMAGKPIFQFAPGSTGAQNYQALAEEVVERIR